ncbi:hypothetical protein CPB83DRAFT_833883 [Crepidotus variabilis]|uniref:Uncharacterized protein n=1 Tax=Crepidotus variabilis TaxID=179855 RepID=A0A9P6EL95_9AGAR|nr:hypothetical protein CPB83DRAFT_833883 [Crepidotus variabilis]
MSSDDGSLDDNAQLLCIGNVGFGREKRVNITKFPFWEYPYNPCPKAYKRRASNIDNFLTKYFTPAEVAHFRYLQSRTQAIISGSMALQFFERIEYPNSDLDIYVENDHKKEIIAWLLQIGYLFESRRNKTLAEEMQLPPPPKDDTIADASGYFGQGVTNVFNFSKDDPERRIQLITSYISPLRVIINFHSTTFNHHLSVKHSTAGGNQDVACQKYADRGWIMTDYLITIEIEDSESEFSDKPRHVGDGFCWQIDILPKLALPEAFAEINSWLFYCGDKHPSMVSWYIYTNGLDFKYIIGEHEIYDFFNNSFGHSYDTYDGPRMAEQKLEKYFARIEQYKFEMQTAETQDNVKPEIVVPSILEFIKRPGLRVLNHNWLTSVFGGYNFLLHLSKQNFPAGLGWTTSDQKLSPMVVPLRWPIRLDFMSYGNIERVYLA